MADAHLPAFRIGALSERTATPGITTSISRPDVSAIKTAEELATDSKQPVFQTTMAQIANSGRLPPEAYHDEGAPYVENHDWMENSSSSDHPMIDIRSALQHKEYSDELNSWLGDPDIASSDLTQSFQVGIGEGQGAAL